MRKATYALSILLLFAQAPCAFPAGIEGLYTYGAKDEATVRIARGKEEGTFAGVVVAASGRWHKKQINLTVLELKKVGEGQFRGRCSAALVRASRDIGRWLAVPKAEVLENGNLRCTLKTDAGASVQVVFERVQEVRAGPAAKLLPSQVPGELAGAWKDPRGAVTHYVSHKDRYVGQIAELSPLLKSHGFTVGEERVRVRRTALGVYRGTMKLRSYGGKQPRWEGVEITVKGDTLELTFPKKGTPRRVRSTAVRLDSRGGTPGGEPLAVGDEGDLAGAWRDPHGAINRYSRKKGNAYAGHIVRLSARQQGYGFTIGEEGLRLKRTGRHTYEGEVLVKSYGGRASWWVRIEITVHKDSLSYIRHLRRGGIERGSAARIRE